MVTVLRRASRAVVGTSAALALAACGATIPTDPDGTLETVRGGTLRAGVSPAEPWTEVHDDGTFSALGGSW